MSNHSPVSYVGVALLVAGAPWAGLLGYVYGPETAFAGLALSTVGLALMGYGIGLEG